MTPEQKAILSGRIVAGVHKKLSELRLAYHAEADGEKREEIQDQLVEAEGELQRAYDEQVALADAMPDPGPLGDGDREMREFDNLYHQAKLSLMVDAIERGKPFEGVEKEVREAFLPEGGRRAEQSIPLAMLLPNDERMEIRQDSATTVDAATGRRMTMPIAQRVFGDSAGAYMGGRFISVPGGQQDFPFIESGTQATAKDENEEIDAGAGKIAVMASNPKEVGAAYLWGLTTQLRYASGELEAALRTDARNVIMDYMDRTVIRGQAAVGASNVPAINGLLSLAYAAESSSAPTTDATHDSMRQFLLAHVDGIWANTSRQARMLVPPGLYKATALLRPHQNSDLTLEDVLAGRFRVSHHLEDGAVNSGKIDSDLLTYAPDRDAGELIIPTWQDVIVTFDVVTLARRRQRRLALDTAYDVLIRRNNPWRRQRAQFTA